MTYCGAIRVPFPVIFHIPSTDFNLLFTRRCKRGQISSALPEHIPASYWGIRVSFRGNCLHDSQLIRSLAAHRSGPLDSGQKGVPNSVWVYQKLYLHRILLLFRPATFSRALLKNSNFMARRSGAGRTFCTLRVNQIPTAAVCLTPQPM